MAGFDWCPICVNFKAVPILLPIALSPPASDGSTSYWNVLSSDSCKLSHFVQYLNLIYIFTLLLKKDVIDAGANYSYPCQLVEKAAFTLMITTWGT